jgi:hypothetical protein
MKRAEGQMQEMPYWMQEQLKKVWDQSGRSMPFSEFLNQFAVDQNINRYAEGFGDPWQIRQTGQEVMPFEDMMEQRAGRLEGIGDAFQQLPGAGATMEGINQNIDELGGAITRTSGQTQGTINDAYNRMRASQQATHGDIVGNIGDTYGGARSGAQGLYGSLLDETDRTYGDLTGSGERTFGEMRGEVEKTSPIGDFAAGRTARSFGPMMRATMQRLRASGVDPNSVEGISALRGVEAERSRAMDDQMARAGERYADRMNQVLSGEQGMRERLGLGRLGFGSGLAREGGAIDRNLLLGSGQEFRNALRENAAIGRGFEQGQMGGTLANLQNTFGRTRDYLGQRNQAEQYGRQIGLEDWQIGAGLDREMNAEDLMGLNLANMQFDRGAAHRARNLGAQETALGNLQGISQQGTQNAQNWMQIGNQMYNPMMQGFQNTYNQEAPNAGYGKKIIGGIGGAALNYFVPGAGTAMNQVFNPGGGGTYQHPNPYGQPPMWQNPTWNPGIGGGGLAF